MREGSHIALPQHFLGVQGTLGVSVLSLGWHFIPVLVEGTRSMDCAAKL